MQDRLSLRGRLVILMVAAILPLFALSFWHALRETRSATQMTQSQLKFAASLVAANQDAAVESARHLLGAISAIPSLASMEQRGCQEVVEGLRRRYPVYSNIGLLAADGRVTCQANVVTAEATSADRAYLREAVAQRRFAMGEVQVGPSGATGIPFAMPVVDAGQVPAVVFATLALDDASFALSRVELPPGARVLVADRHQRLLMEHPQRSSLPLPRSLRDIDLAQVSRSMAGGTGTGPDQFGQERLYAVVPSRLVGNEGLLAIVSIDKAGVVSGTFASLRKELLMLGLTLLAGVGAAWWVGGRVVFSDITAMQQLQEEQALQFKQLRDTQLKLIEAQRVGKIGNFDTDLVTGRLWWSDEMFQLFGVERNAFSGTLQDFLSRIHPGDRQRHAEAREAALTRGRPMNMEYRIVRPDGSLAWMHDIAEMRCGGDGRPAWYGGVVQDITARKQAELALLDSECELQDFTRMLQRAAEAAQDITSRKSLDDTLQAVVAQSRHVIGAHQAVISLTTGSDWAQVVSALSVSDRYHDYREEMPLPDGSGIYALACETGRPLRLTHAQLLAHPRWRNFGGRSDHPPINGLLAVPLVDRDGANIGLLMLSDKDAGEFSERDEYVAVELSQLASIAIDNARLFQQVMDFNAGLETGIAERTAALSQQDARYRALADQAPEVVWNVDPAGGVIYLNRAWSDLVGGQPDDWLGSRWVERIHPDDVVDMTANWKVARATLTPYSGTRRVRALDGSYHTMSYRGAPVFDDRGEVVFWVGIDTDITGIKAIERALRSSNQELEAFSYSVSHDLRAPLGAIGGFSRALSHRLATLPDERVHHFLARIQAGVERMEQLIESLLALAKVVRAPLHYEEVDLGLLAREALEELREAQPQRAVDVTIADGLLALGDVRLLRVALQNLLGNAWKFTSKRARATIEVGRLADSKVFFVRDNGVGFDMAYADKLFGAFQRLHTEAEFPGTGIGLATVRRIIARHQGRVWGESQLDQGTTFYFVLSEVPPPSWLADQGASDLAPLGRE